MLDEEKSKGTWGWIRDWNKKLYETKVNAKPLDADALWEEFKLKSWPKFKNECGWNIPDTWADDIRGFLREVQLKFRDEVDLIQVKEKWAQLRVYYDTKNESFKPEMERMIDALRKKLIDKGYHPD